MTRMTMDCRTMPSESGCSLVISGEEDEVLRAAVAHAVDVHGHTDGDELRNGLRASLTEAPLLELQPGAFVQLIEFRTHRIDELLDLAGGWVEAIGSDRTARWEVLGVDRNKAGRYVQVVAFPDHEAAMANSKHPATATFAAKLGELCEGEVGFTDLDVREIEVF
jgi:quinol monooxygenase YgiN/predicted small metal-binding protein